MHYDDQGLGGLAGRAGEGDGEAVRADVDEGVVGARAVVGGGHFDGSACGGTGRRTGVVEVR